MSSKTVYLTIDDGPSADFRPKAEYLLERRVPAVLFCRGDFLEQRREQAIWAVQQGFIIGNHSYNHSRFSYLSLAEACEQIGRTDAIIDEIYVDAGIRRPAKWFRFPGGDKGGMMYSGVFKPRSGKGQAHKDAIQAFLRRYGYEQPAFTGITYGYCREGGLLRDADWHWTYDCGEYHIDQPHPHFGIDTLEKALARMDEDVPEGGRGLNYPGSEDIILLHDIERTTHVFMPIVDRLIAGPAARMDAGIASVS